jgi:hypothetical protein
VLGRNAFVGIVAGAMILWMQGISDARPPASVEMACHDAAPGAVTVTFEWKAPDAGVIETRLDLGVGPEFIDGTYQTFGPFRPEVRAHVIGGAVAGLRYRYRVSALHADGPREVAAGSFVAMCPAGMS